MSEEFSEKPLVSPRNRFDEDDDISIQLGSRRGYRISPAGVSNVLQVFLILSIAVSAVGAVVAWIQYETFFEMEIVPGARQSNEGFFKVIFFANWGVRLIMSFFFLRWTYVTKANVHGFGARDLDFTPGWSVGWYFVPFLNLIRPFQALRETWQASQSPRNWRSVSGFGLLRLWWALVLGTSVGTGILARAIDEHMPFDGYRSIMFSAAVTFVGLIALDLVTRTTVRTIDGFQEEWVNGRDALSS